MNNNYCALKKQNYISLPPTHEKKRSFFFPLRCSVWISSVNNRWFRRNGPYGCRHTNSYQIISLPGLKRRSTNINYGPMLLLVDASNTHQFPLPQCVVSNVYYRVLHFDALYVKNESMDASRSKMSFIATNFSWLWVLKMQAGGGSLAGWLADW